MEVDFMDSKRKMKKQLNNEIKSRQQLVSTLSTVVKEKEREVNESTLRKPDYTIRNVFCAVLLALCISFITLHDNLELFGYVALVTICLPLAILLFPLIVEDTQKEKDMTGFVMGSIIFAVLFGSALHESNKR